MAEGKAGSMGSGVAWLIALGSALVVGGLGFVVASSGLTWLLSLVIYGAAGWAAVYMTKSGAGLGIVAFLVAGILAGVLTYFSIKSQISAAVGAGGNVMGEMAKLNQTPEGQKAAAQLAQLGESAGGALGTLGGVMGFVVALFRCFIIGMIGCLVGNSMKKSALGGAQAKAA